MLSDLVNLTTVASAVIAVGVSIVGSYLAVRLTLKDHANEIDNLRREIGRLRDALQLHEDDGHQDRLSAISDELLTVDGRFSQRLLVLERGMPNCAAHRAEFSGKLDAMKAEMQVTLLTRLMEIAEQNIRFREELRQRFQTDTQEITREMLSPAGVAALVANAVEKLREGELRDIFHRLNELERRQ
jgi:D-ribose pyranose/furanose isomerase RbsD